MIAQSISWIFIFLAGGLLGLFYFGGLLLTIRKMTQWKQPALLMILSLFVRVAIVISGFYWLTEGQWRELLVAFFGFIVIRMIMVRRFGPMQSAPVISP